MLHQDSRNDGAGMIRLPIALCCPRKADSISSRKIHHHKSLNHTWEEGPPRIEWKEIRDKKYPRPNPEYCNFETDPSNPAEILRSLGSASDDPSDHIQLEENRGEVRLDKNDCPKEGGESIEGPLCIIHCNEYC